MLAYLLLVLVSTLAGFGVLSACGVTLGQAQRWYLSPGACLVAWAVVIGVAVSAAVPVRDLALPLWLATGVAAAYGVWRARIEWTREAVVPLAVIVAIPVGLMAFDFAHGLANYIGGPAADGWSYVAYGQYLWELPKGTEGSLSPLHQYATHVSRTRFISSALLGLLSPLTGQPGDTQPAAGLFVAWTLFVFGASCAGYGVASVARRWWLVWLCLLAVTSRWVYGAVEIHNYDNLLAISFLPFALGIVTGTPAPSRRGDIVLGVTAAASIYAYPEMASVVFFGLALAMLTRAVADGHWVAWIGSGVTIVGLAVVLVLPARGDLSWFISNQIAAASAPVTSRPGEGSFAEVMNLRDWTAAFWGYGPAAAPGGLRAAWGIGRHALGAVLWLLAIIGAARLVARRHWEVVALASALTGAALFMVVHEHYSYGAYKLLLVACWAPALCVVCGAQAVAERAMLGRQSRPVTFRTAMVAISSAVLLCAVVSVAAAREVAFRRAIVADSIEPYRTLVNIDHALGPEPILVSVDDTLANQWAVYFLRDRLFRLAGYRSYMAQPHVVPSMDRSRAVDLGAVRYVLSDAVALDNNSSDQHDIAWADGPYALWRIPAHGAVVVVSVSNPNGSEQVDGRSFYWIGEGDTSVDLLATSEGEAVISARFTRGPSLPGAAERRLALSANGGTPQLVTIDRDGEFALPVRVRRGENRVLVHPLDRPTAVSPNDPRPLLVGVAGLRARMAAPALEQPKVAVGATTTCTATFISGWHPREPMGAGWLQWSSGTGRLRVASKETADFELDGELLSFTRPNAVEVAINGKRVATWIADDPSWGPHAFTPVPFHIEAGRAAVIELTSRAKPVIQQADRRPLAIALKDVIVKRRDGPAVCAEVEAAAR
ncbi:MAG: hypothetical protein ABMA15_08305 [Vicinamibacterales bacterium]